LPADGASAPRILLAGSVFRLPGSFTPDGRTLLYVQVSRESQYAVYAQDLDSSSPRELKTRGEPRLVLSNAGSPAISPDGRWLAFERWEGQRNEIYVCAYPSGTALWRVSNGGGISPRWSRKRRELVYEGQRGSILRVPYQLRAGELIPAPVSVGKNGAEAFRSTPHLAGSFDLDPIAERLLLLSEVDPRGEPLSLTLSVVLNFFRRDGGPKFGAGTGADDSQ
jgi:hypothetical protein